jgi:hypothetical protein
MKRINRKDIKGRETTRASGLSRYCGKPDRSVVTGDSVVRFLPPSII